MAETYQVTGECAHVTVNTQLGPTVQLVYKGQLVPPGTSPERIKHLLDSGLIKRLDDPADAAPANPSILPPTETGTGHGQSVTADSTGDDGKTNPDEERADEQGAESSDDDTETRRAAAREKLAALGGRAPDGRHSADVLVEYLVTQGGRYEDLIRAEKGDLVDMVKARQG